LSKQAQILWELLELEAKDKFYVGNRENPAFLLFPKYSPLCMDKKVTLYMNGVGLIDTFKSEKAALERLKQIIENANFAVQVYKVSKYGRQKGKRVLFAENTVDRIDNETMKGHCRVFEIDEWKEVALTPTTCRKGE